MTFIFTLNAIYKDDLKLTFNVNIKVIVFQQKSENSTRCNEERNQAFQVKSV